MEISKLPPEAVPEDLRSESSTAVATLHQTLVVLRQELDKRDKKIQQLEQSMLQLSTNGPVMVTSTPAKATAAERPEKPEFSDIFDLLPSSSPTQTTASSVGQRRRSVSVTASEVEQILLYEEQQLEEDRAAAAAAEQEEARKKAEALRNYDTVVEDPIMEFVLSEEDDEEDKKNHVQQQGNATPPPEVNIRLVPHQDIVFHAPPTSEPRPILKTPVSPESAKSCSGSQTDITAVDSSSGGRLTTAQSSAVSYPDWSSEPHLPRPRTARGERSVDLRREMDGRCSTMSNAGSVKRGDSKEDSWGRYSILHRDFTPKRKDSFEEAVEVWRSKMDSVMADASTADNAERYGVVETVAASNMKRCLVDSTPMDTESDDSTEALLTEAREYVKLANSFEQENKLLTVSDWKKIKQVTRQSSRIRQSKRKLETRLSPLSNATPSSSLLHGQPFVPYLTSDLKLGNVVRFVFTASPAGPADSNANGPVLPALLPTASSTSSSALPPSTPTPTSPPSTRDPQPQPQQLVHGVVRYLGRENQVVGVETRGRVDEEQDWRNYFSSSTGHGLLLPLRKIILCLQ